MTDIDPAPGESGRRNGVQRGMLVAQGVAILSVLAGVFLVAYRSTLELNVAWFPYLMVIAGFATLFLAKRVVRGDRIARNVTLVVLAILSYAMVAITAISTLLAVTLVYESSKTSGDPGGLVTVLGVIAAVFAIGFFGVVYAAFKVTVSADAKQLFARH